MQSCAVTVNNGSDESGDADTWNGFTLVGDNLDINVTPRYKRVDRQTQSLHFFYSYAVRDRVNLAGFSDDQTPYADMPIETLPLKNLLPTSSDHQGLIHSYGILVSRVLVEELTYFSKTFEGGTVTSHIQHEHADEMSKPSETVSYFILQSISLITTPLTASTRLLHGCYKGVTTM